MPEKKKAVRHSLNNFYVCWLLFLLPGRGAVLELAMKISFEDEG
jgi:hypothetical protein